MEEDLTTKRYRDKNGDLKVGTLVSIKHPEITRKCECEITSIGNIHFGSRLYRVNSKSTLFRGSWTELHMTILGSKREFEIKNIKV